MSTFTTLVVGLPGAGKTTFLAALWDALNSESCALRLVSLGPEREYLNEIASAWRQCEPVPRTRLSTEHSVTLHVTLASDAGRSVEVLFPDHAGEKFVHQWTHREWDADYAALVERSDAVLIFINPDEHNPSPTIPEAALLLGDATIEEGTNEAGDGTEWDPSDTPGDVLLTDLVQCILWYRRDRPLATTVIISAWDVVEHLVQSPEEWLDRHSPLLAQFLGCSPSVTDLQIFGVSSQGGDLAVDADRLLSCDKPCERVSVRRGADTFRDITQPILSLLSISPRER